MAKALRLRSAVLAVGLLCLTSGCTSSTSEQPADARPSKNLRAGVVEAPAPVILVGIDGFRYDYLDLYQPPNLLALAQRGVRAERLIPSFPSKTFPNHYTLVTGLVPDRNGIVSNNIRDPELGKFSLGNRKAVSDGRWWEGEPIWVTAQRQGLKAAAMFWPGSEAEIQGLRPSYWMTYDDDLPGRERIDQIVDWLSLPLSERPSFLTLYFSAVDSAGHRHGPHSDETKAAVLDVDAHLGDLMQRLDDLALPVHWVVVSDHGMSETAPERVVFVDDVLDLDDWDIIDLSPVLAISPAPGVEVERGWEAAITSKLDALDHVSAYRREDLPVHLDHGRHNRVAPVLALVDEGWRFSIRRREEERPQRGLGGQHGYDPSVDSMGALLVVAGPRIEVGELGPVLNTNIYALMCELLGIQPAANDGSLKPFSEILKPATN